MAPPWELMEVVPPVPHDHLVQSTVTDRMKCPISLQVMEDPASLITCGHFFEHSQIQNHLKAMKNCPKCRVPVRGASQVRRSQEYQCLIREVVHTRCVVPGCEEVVKLDSLESHVNSHCPHARYRCTQLDLQGQPCGHMANRATMADHDLQCPHRVVACDRCGEDHRQDQRAEHRRTCPEEPVRCSLCKEMMRRRQVESHDKDPGVMAIHIRLLTEENIKLMDQIQRTRKEDSSQQEVRVMQEAHRDHLLDSLRSIVNPFTLVPAQSGLLLSAKMLWGQQAYQHMTPPNASQREKPLRVVMGLTTFLSQRCSGEPGQEADVLSAAMAALHRVLDHGTTAAIKFKEDLAHGGTCTTLLRAMRACPGLREVQLQGCFILLGLYGNVGNNKGTGKPLPMLKQLLCEQLGADMAAFPEDRTLSLACFRLLAVLATLQEGAGELLQAGALSRVVVAMERLATRNDRLIQQEGCVVLAEVAQHGGDYREAVVKAGGGERVVATMKAFPDFPTLQVEAFWALSYLTVGGHKEARRRLLKAGAAEAVVRAQRSFPGNDTIKVGVPSLLKEKEVVVVMGGE